MSPNTTELDDSGEKPDATQADVSPDAWVVQFDVPYFVSVADSMDDPTLRKWAEDVGTGASPNPVPYSPRLKPGGVFAIAATAPYHLPDPNDLADPFEVPVDDGEIRLRFLRRMRNVDRSMVMAGETRPDRGVASFTTVQAMFSTGLSKSFGVNDLGDVADTALAALNTFLEQYRHTAAAFWAQPITHAHVPEFEVWRHYADGRPAEWAVHSSPPGGPLIVGRVLVDQERATAIRARLHSGESTPFAYEVILSAKEHLHRERYRNAVVDAATAFEVYVADVIRGRLTDLGWAPGAIDSVFVNEGGRYRGVQDLVKEVLDKAAGVPFAGRAEYRDLISNTFDVRNDVVHAGLRPTPEAAALAISSAEVAQAVLASDLRPAATTQEERHQPKP